MRRQGMFTNAGGEVEQWTGTAAGTTHIGGNVARDGAMMQETVEADC